MKNRILVLEEEALQLFKQQLIKEVKEAIQRPDTPKQVYTYDETAELLGVSKKTLQRWRDEGKIGYSITGREIFFQWEDIKEFLDNHRRSPF